MKKSIRIDGMNCGHCTASVEKALRAVPGVTGVSVDLASKTASVETDGASDAALKQQMFNTFNMGIGFVLAIAPEDVRQTLEYLDNAGFPAWEIGSVAAGGAARGIVRFV